MTTATGAKILHDSSLRDGVDLLQAIFNDIVVVDIEIDCQQSWCEKWSSMLMRARGMPASNPKSEEEWARFKFVKRLA